MKLPLILFFLSAFSLFAQEADETVSAHLLPDHIMPQLGCWFWSGEELVGDGYRKYIDMFSAHSPYKVLTTSFRFPDRELTDSGVCRQVELAAQYARQKGIGLALDLDVRLARRSFLNLYPDEMQEMLILQELKLERTRENRVVMRSKDLNDHYTGRTEHYVALKGEVKRVYAYDKSGEQIDGSSLVDVSRECRVEHCSKDSIILSLPGGEEPGRAYACVMVSFTHLSPAVFAPHLESFQRELLRRYAHIDLAGVCKDEWGFPPCFEETFSEFWYSAHRAEAYAERTGGRVLLEDCLLMSLGIKGRERERIMAVNHFREMSRQRNAGLEDDFYRSVKEIYGPQAIVATHPTWYPYPGFREFKKNGLHWWAATRDWAQTDEVTPFGVRTALAKKWGSSLWYNMYYHDNIPAYNRSVWSHALGGGRINYHPIYPGSTPGKREAELLKGDLMRAECRVRLLNYISDSPLDCPVAVVFGHASAMNWTGDGYDDVGMALVDRLWASGIPADLIPTTEIRHLETDPDGWISYGPQRYAALVLYHPEFENPATAEFFRRAEGGKTRMFRVGGWTMDFNGTAFNGVAALPASMAGYPDTESVLDHIHKVLQEEGIPLQTAASDKLSGFGYQSSCPPATGHCRLLDGTIIRVAGSEQVAGDPINLNLGKEGLDARFDAIGVAALRMDEQGRVCALAAGGLKYFQGGGLEINLDERTDLALWKNSEGEWEGVLQGLEGEIPSGLLEITRNWSRLSLPVKYTDN